MESQYPLLQPNVFYKTVYISCFTVIIRLCYLDIRSMHQRHKKGLAITLTEKITIVLRTSIITYLACAAYFNLLIQNPTIFHYLVLFIFLCVAIVCTNNLPTDTCAIIRKMFPPIWSVISFMIWFVIIEIIELVFY